jgi:hypothetical protein
MNKIKAYIAILIGLMFFSSCTEDINNTPLDFHEISTVFEDSIYIRQFVNVSYNYLPDGYNRLGGNSMLASATDQAVHSADYSGANELAQGTWGPGSNPDNSWNGNYAGIRKVNDFFINLLPNIQEKVFNSQESLDQIVGAAYFLRGMFYFELVKRYGGVPIITEKLEADSETNIPRNTIEECMDYIVSQCDSAASLLPVQYPNNNQNDLGRATKGAALALKARTLLYAASPLFNDPAESEDTYFHGAYDTQKWTQAAEAAYEVIALNEYSLYPDYTGFFTTLAGNNEIILSKMRGINNNVEQDNGPTGLTNGKGGTGPSLNLVNAYEMADGTPFDWSNPTMATDPFANRDPRFYSSILYNGSTWMGSTVDTYQGGDDLLSTNSTKTSFYMRKFLDENAKWFGQTGKTYHCFPIIRYAEILLNYAEAMNEAYGPEADPQGYGLTAKDAVEMIRSRAGISPYELATGLSKSDMREVVRHERLIELAFEEHRFFDVRRWKTAEEVLTETIEGLSITDNGDGSYSYEIIEVESRVFTPKMYIYPIPLSEINRNTALEQSPQW